MTKKCIFMIIGVLVIFIILTGCSNSGKNDEVSFKATVLENNQSNLLVEPEEGSAELSSADKIMVSVSDAILLNSQDTEISIEDIETGKQIEIYYDGMIAESYPAQINQCYRVIVLS